MSVETIIQAGEFNWIETLMMILDFRATIMLSIFAIVSFVLFFITLPGVDYILERVINSIIFTVLIIAILFSMLLLDQNYLIGEDSEPVKKWIDEYVVPFMDSTEEVSYKVKSVEMSSANRSELESKTIGESKEGAINMDVLYLDEESQAKMMSVNATVHYVVDEDEEEYIVFKKIEEDLGNGITPGYYNPVIYLKK